MRRFFRPRLTLLTMMLIVAVFAGAFGTYAAIRRQRHIAVLRELLKATEARVEWAGRMNRKGYVSRAQFAAEMSKRDAVRAELKSLGALSEGS